MQSAHKENGELPPLVGNSVTSISIHGLAADHHGHPITLCLPCHAPGKLKERYYDTEGYFGITYDREMPRPNPPVPPRPGQTLVQLHLQLGDIISFNERHAVYNVRVVEADPPTFYIPPLVIKVARTDEAGSGLSSEARMYEHIRRLQGVVTPRCYGYFHVDNQHCGWTRVSPPVPDVGDTTPTEEDYSDFVPEPDSDEEADAVPAPAGPPPCTRMDVLLLEKVGGHLPYGEQLPDQIIDDLRDMHYELASYRVHYSDWRAANVAYAPVSPPGLPGRSSWFYKRAYTLRLIDFEDALFTNGMPVYHRSIVDDRLPRLLRHVMNA